MSKKVAIDYGLDKWRKRLDDDTISLDKIRNTYKLFHNKDLGTKHLDYNIRLAFKTKFKDQLANFAGTDKFCYNCKTMANREIKETFLHGCYSCPYVNPICHGEKFNYSIMVNDKVPNFLTFPDYIFDNF